MIKQNENKELQMLGDNRLAQIDCLVKPPLNTFENKDCMDILIKCPADYFDLAIVDPPYMNDTAYLESLNATRSINFNYDNIRNNAPGVAYFNELKRVSKNQIIFGGNYFTDKLEPSRCWIIWYKKQTIETYADCELAWTSFNKNSKVIELESYGFNHADKRLRGEATIHPTQKPVALYKWILNRYATPGMKILDTHVGSGSSLIACIEAGYDYYGTEINEEYFRKAKNRIGGASRMYGLFERSV